LLAVACVAGAVAQDGEAVKTEGSKRDEGLYPRVKISTNLGDIVVELNAEKAPITADNFIQYAEDGFYKGLIFHRVMKTFMIQGGGYTADMDEKKDDLRAPIKNEWNNGLKNTRGTIAMARMAVADSATAQFFINVVDNASLDIARPKAGDAAYCVFGKVVEGMDVVDKIRDSEVKAHPKLPMGPVVPVETVLIGDVSIVGTCDREKIKGRVKAVETESKEAEAAAGKAQAQLAAAFQQAMEKMEDAEGRKMQTTDSGLQYFVLNEGDGASPEPTDTVVVHYTGWTLEGKKFDSSYDHPGGKPATFRLNGVIKGWTEGVGMMMVGGKRRLYIPGDLAYGPGGNPGAGIKPNATLVFDVELLEIK
jgi:FKBP-type peptidyl-prolyl cis-trans isomerase